MLFALVRFGTDTNFAQHSDANSGAIGENMISKLPIARSYCALYLTTCFGAFCEIQSKSLQISVIEIARLELIKAYS